MAQPTTKLYTVSNTILPTTPVLNINAVGGSPTVTFTPDDAIIEIFQDGKSIVKLKQNGVVIWADKLVPNAAASAFGEALRGSIPIMAGIETRGRHIIEEDLISFLSKIADQEGPLSADDLEIAFEHICAMKRLKGEI